MSRLLVVSNRLPVSVSRRKGELQFTPSPGGVATGLASVSKSADMEWVGWPGIAADRLSRTDCDKVVESLAADHLHPVFLTKKQVDRYYYGFSNKTIWPLFHYFSLYALFRDELWEAYVEVNRAFCDVVVSLAEPGDRIWVHDYQLLLLPGLLRERLPNAAIGFFLHIPFPSSEILRTLPWRGELLRGLLGADLIGFHTYDYMRHFLSSASRIEGVHHSLGRLAVGEREAVADAFPMGIDYETYAGADERDDVRSEVENIRTRIGRTKTILSMDRLDYTKGIIERVEAFDWFLTTHPEHRRRVVMMLLAVPSRTDIDRYRHLRQRLEALVSRINGEHGTFDWMPIWYLYRRVPFERLVAMYKTADVALITPLCDGMNLIAKEYVAARGDTGGVLVLSEMAGAASELGEAIIVNPKDKAAIVRAIGQALEMPLDEQVQRNARMQQRLSRYTVQRWAADFLDALDHTAQARRRPQAKRLDEAGLDRIVRAYGNARRRLLLLDYDGTLIGFSKRAEDAVPDPELVDVLRTLADAPGTDVVLVSGRDRYTLERWFGDIDVDLVAEHGGWTKKVGGGWQRATISSPDWKAAIRPILDVCTDRTPGSYVEEKDFSLVWHVRMSDADLAGLRAAELRDAVQDLTANLDVGIYEGDKIIEIKPGAVHKGTVATRWLQQADWDFVLAMGDDYTDEDMFAALAPQAYSIKVGRGASKARFTVRDVDESRRLLHRITGDAHVES